MRRTLLPHPLMSLALVLVWLLLVNDISIGHILFGALLGIGIPVFTNNFWPERPRIARPGLILLLSGRMLYDIVVANFTVARQILSSRKTLNPDFVEFPLELKDEFAITVLANLISLTPGTVSADLSEDRRFLIVHALNVADKAALIEEIKQRYERTLKEIFPC